MKRIGTLILVTSMMWFSVARADEPPVGAGLAPIKEAAISIDPKSKEIKWGPAPEFLPKGSQLAVLHGDPAKRNADALLKVPAHAKIPNHWHTSAERMILISGELSISFEGQSLIKIKPGSYAYSPAKLKHEGECVSKTPCLLFIAFEEPIDAVPVLQQ